MRVNVDSVNQLINTKFRGNQTFFAETIQIDRCYLNQILYSVFLFSYLFVELA